LEKAGLLKVVCEGASDRVSANSDHPAAELLVKLLDTSESVAKKPTADRQAEESLTYYGAPLSGRTPQKHFSLEETLVRGLRAAKRNATLLKVLPVVLAKNADTVVWSDLKERARREHLKGELGMLVELTADVAKKPWLKERVAALQDHRRKVTTLFSENRSKHERKLAEMATPTAVRRWHFLMNLSEETFRATVQKHLG